jgi:hypothetical protein
MPFLSLFDGGDTNTATAVNAGNINIGGSQDNTAVANAGSFHGSSGHGLVNLGDVNTATAVNAGNVNIGGHQDNTAVANAGSTHGLHLIPLH